MNILGLTGQLHDAAAAIVKDGRVVAAVEEERFVRRKFIGIEQAGGLPYRSIDYCLRDANISIEDIDHVGYFFQPLSEFFHYVPFRLSKFPWAPRHAMFHVVKSAN